MPNARCLVGASYQVWVRQVLRCGEEDYRVVAIEGASPLMPLSWLILLAGWSYSPTVEDATCVYQYDLRKEQRQS